MHIICLTPLAPGVYNDHKADHIAFPPDGWAYIPEDFALPSTFPRLGSIEAEEVTYTREGMVEYTMMTVTAMTEGTMPEPSPETDEISDSEALRIITGEVDIDEAK